MYMTEDISKFLREEHPLKIMVLLGHPDKLDITSVSDKLLLARAWVKAFKPQDKLPKLKEYLGEYWQAYIHPLIDKLYTLDLKDMVTGDIGEQLSMDHAPIVKEIIDFKLVNWLEHAGVTKLATETKFINNTKRHKTITYQFKSKYSDSYILKITLDWLGFNSTCTVSFLNVGYSTADLVEESHKQVQGLMFNLSQDWELKYLNNILSLLKFDNVILDCLIQNIIKYRKEAGNLS